jgi:hypothetical protein
MYSISFISWVHLSEVFIRVLRVACTIQWIHLALFLAHSCFLYHDEDLALFLRRCLTVPKYGGFLVSCCMMMYICT